MRPRQHIHLLSLVSFWSRTRARIVSGPRSIVMVSIMALLNFVASSEAQPSNAPAVQWQRTYGGSHWETTSAILELPEGGFLLGGQSFSAPGGTKTSTNFGDYDYWIVRLDRDGHALWDRSFGGSEQESFETCILTVDGGFVLAGRSFSPPGGNKTAANFGGADYWIVRTDAQGNKLWDRSFGGADWDECMSMVQTPDGGFLAGGRSQSGVSGNKSTHNSGGWDYWVIRLDAAGNKLWERSYGGTGYDALSGMVLTPDNGFLLGGSSASKRSGNKRGELYGGTDYWVVRIDSDGDVLWDQSYGGDNGDEAYGIVGTPDHGFVIGGWSDSPAGTGNKTAPKYGITDGWIVRADSDGNKLWDRSAGPTNINSSDYFWSLERTADGGFIVGGGSEGDVDSFYLDAWVVRFDRHGERLWEKLVGSFGMDRFFAVRQASDGGFLLSGDFDAFGGGCDALLTKFAPDALTRPPILRVAPQSFSSMTNTGFRMALSGSSNVAYRIEVASELGNWRPLQTNVLTGQEEQIVDWEATNDVHRAYRATILPR